MRKGHRITAIICAAGRGSRAGFEKNKLLVPFMGANALYYSVKAFYGIADEIVVACSPCDMQEVGAICAHFGAKTVTGGERRTDSVYSALKVADGDIVLIHDGARPFVTGKQIERCIDDTLIYGSSVTACPATDTVAIACGDKISSVPPRADVYNVQTPQGFLYDDIKAAYDRAVADGGTFTDDASVYCSYVAPAHISDSGSQANKKLTFGEDLSSPFPPLPPLQKGYSAGIGIDVHTFGKAQSYVVLCGAKIPCDSGLVAHSDGDVAAHAVTDAVLSAAGLKDIGTYFPDTDPAYCGADSMALLKKATRAAESAGFRVVSLSLAIQAEKPRIKAHIDEMKHNLSLATGADQRRIAVGAGTCEGLGFVGEGLGICAYCCAVLEEIEQHG